MTATTIPPLLLTVRQELAELQKAWRSGWSRAEIRMRAAALLADAKYAASACGSGHAPACETTIKEIAEFLGTLGDNSQ